MLSRDELITRGEAAAALAEAAHAQGNRTSQWIYHAKVKSGTRATANIEREYWNIPHLMGSLVERFARGEETIHIYAIRRVMKKHLRSRREDI